MGHLGEGRRVYACLVALATCLGCTGDDATGTPPKKEEEAAARVLALGDSYTIGEGEPADARWPVQLVARLRAAGVAVGEPEVIARTGWTTDELDAAIDRAAPRGPFELVTLLVGVNDQFRGRPLDGTRARFRALLARAVAFAGGDATRVLVLSVPDWGVTPFAARDDRGADVIAREIDALNATQKDEVANAGARWLDVTAISREAARDRALLAKDGLHPSRAMYARWAEAAEPLAHAALVR